MARTHIAASLDAPEKITVHELLRTRSTVRRTQIFVRSVEEAQAAEVARIDVLNIAMSPEAATIAASAPGSFNMFGLHWKNFADRTELMRGAFDAIFDGADSVYVARPPGDIEALAEQGIPVCTHVGLVPTKRTWTGGWRAVGKTREEARKIWQTAREYESAGAFAIELECVPQQLAAEIARRMSLLVISMGSGSGCHVQYLFASDILGQSTGRFPRHSRQYRDFNAELARLQEERVAAFTEFRQDVEVGAFPRDENVIDMKEAEYEAFLSDLD